MKLYEYTVPEDKDFKTVEEMVDGCSMKEIEAEHVKKGDGSGYFVSGDGQKIRESELNRGMMLRRRYIVTLLEKDIDCAIKCILERQLVFQLEEARVLAEDFKIEMGKWPYEEIGGFKDE